MDHNMTSTLLRHWVVTVDPQGHEQLEARWALPQIAAAQAA